MKSLVVGMIFLCSSLIAVANDDLKFKKCSMDDQQLLQLAEVVVAPAEESDTASVSPMRRSIQMSLKHKLAFFISKEVMPSLKTCKVAEPRYVFPMVCGHYIYSDKIFQLTTIYGEEISVTLRKGYRSCVDRSEGSYKIQEIKFPAIQD